MLTPEEARTAEQITPGTIYIERIMDNDFVIGTSFIVDMMSIRIDE